MGRLHLEILAAAQRALWEELQQVPPRFVLYGETAIALQLGHRQSVDFDFCSTAAIDSAALFENVPFLSGAVTVRQAPDTLTLRVDRGAPVVVSFMAVRSLRQLLRPTRSGAGGCHIASLLDLAATKASVVQQRAEAKDYIDLDALIRSGLPLARILSAALLAFGERFDPQSTLKALSFFGDGDLGCLPEDTRQRLRHSVRAVDPALLAPLDIMPTDIGA
jgi:hypothetical protein